MGDGTVHNVPEQPLSMRVAMATMVVVAATTSVPMRGIGVVAPFMLEAGVGSGLVGRNFLGRKLVATAVARRRLIGA